jgi:hypothetical protein
MATREPHETPGTDLLVAAGRERTILASGFLAGTCVFFAPLVILALGLLAAYLAYVASDGHSTLLGLGRPLTSDDFRSVFAPAVNEAPLLVSAGLAGMFLSQLRRWLARRADPAFLVAGRRPFFPEFCLLYVLLVGLTLAFTSLNGGVPQLNRLLGAAHIYLLFMLCATWLAHAVWQYCFQNIVDLLASQQEREAALALRGQARLLGHSRSAR